MSCDANFVKKGLKSPIFLHELHELTRIFWGQIRENFSSYFVGTIYRSHFKISRYALAQPADETFKMPTEAESRKFPQKFTLAENENVILDFEKLLNRYQKRIPVGSPLEEASVAILEMREMYKDKSIHDKKVDCRERWRCGLFLADVARKALEAEPHPDFKNLLAHLDLLLQPSNFSQFSAVLPSASPKERETNNKVFELLMGVVLFRVFSNLKFDDPAHSKGGNPDVIGEYKNKRWGIACKVSHSENPKTFLDRVSDGIEQIEKADVDHGLIIVNLKNLIHHDTLWPAEKDETEGNWIYGAFQSKHAPAQMIEIMFEKFRQHVYTAAGGPASFINKFAGKKTVPLVLSLCSCVASHNPRPGIIGPIVVKRLFSLGTALDQLPTEAAALANLINDYLHDKIDVP